MICLTVWLSGFNHKKASSSNLESAGARWYAPVSSELNLSFNDTFSARLPDAYERPLMDTARGNQTLFMRHDEVLAAWAFIDPVISLASELAPSLYRQGTFGPADHFGGEDDSIWIDPSEDPGQ